MPVFQEYHSFKVKFSCMILPDGKMVGIDNAIMLQDIAYWCDYNRSSGCNYFDGRYWTYSTMDAICERHPYWTKKQVRRILDRCKEIGFLLVGNYNKSSYDRTIWYSVSDEVLNLLGFSGWANASAQTGKWESPNGQMEKPIRANGMSQKGTPIPNNKTNNITDTKQIFNSFLELGHSEGLIATVKDWITYKKERGQNYQAIGLRQFLEKIDDSIKKYGEASVVETIKFSMASNYSGIMWDKIETQKNDKPYKYPTYTPEELEAMGSL